MTEETIRAVCRLGNNVYYVSRRSGKAWLIRPDPLMGYPLDSYSKVLSPRQVNSCLRRSPNSFTTQLPQPPNYYVQSI